MDGTCIRAGVEGEEGTAPCCRCTLGPQVTRGSRNVFVNKNLPDRNGFALEYQISRVLFDARILNICEGAAGNRASTASEFLY